MYFYNWNKTAQSEPEKVFKPKTEEEIVSILKLVRGKNKQVRVVGPARHTWGEISMSDGFVIDMHHFNKLLSVDVKNKTVTVQAGLAIHKLFRKLARHGLSVNNMGGIDAQSIAGVVATGTHGSSIYHGTFSDDILSMRVMLYDGSIVALDKNNPEFPAFMVNLGALGVIIDLTIQCTDIFYVKSKTEEVQMNYKELTREKLIPLLRSNYFFQVAIDPYSQKMTFYERKRIAVHELSLFKRNVILPVASVIQNIKELTGIFLVEYVVLKIVHAFPNITEKISALSSKFAKENFTDISFRALTIGGNDAHGFYINKTFHDQEYAISLDDVSSALGIILGTFQKFPNMPLLLALRFVEASAAWLSPSYGKDTCYIDVLIFSKDFEVWSPFVEQVEKALFSLGARPHWGKHNFLTYKILSENSLYPKLEDWRKIKKKYDPHNLFGNSYIDKRLDPIPTGY